MIPQYGVIAKFCFMSVVIQELVLQVSLNSSPLALSGVGGVGAGGG